MIENLGIPEVNGFANMVVTAGQRCQRRTDLGIREFRRQQLTILLGTQH